MPAYVVTRRDPRRIAGAVIRYQLTQPRLLVTMVAVLVVVALLGSSFSAGAAVVGVVVFAVLFALVIAYKRGQLATTLAARGFRPGSTVSASADGAALTVTAVTGTGRHPWAEIDHVRVINGIVLFRVRAARFVVAVPVDALPGTALARVASSGAATTVGPDA